MGESGTGDAADRDGPADGNVLRRRRAEIEERIEQLHERKQELAGRRDRGPTSPEEVDAARAAAADAEEHAQEGHVHAARAHERTAARHVEAAELHERVADVLDEHDRPQRALAHREAAETDRDAAVQAEQRAQSE